MISTGLRVPAEQRTAPIAAPARERKPLFIGCVIACCALLACAVSSGSLWMDEGYIAWVVGHGTPQAVISALREAAVRPADQQYPLYDLWEWAWSRWFGSSEYALRSANIPFAVVYVWALAWTSRAVFGRALGWIPFAFVPFIWFYINEARPYLMLAAVATCAVGSAVTYAFGAPVLRARALPFVLPLLCLTCSTHILGFMLLPGLTIILWAGSTPGRFSLWPQWRRSIAIWVVPFVLITAFYGATLWGSAARAEITNNEGRGPSPVASAAEILYEQAGFGGLGPARNTLRRGVHVADVLAFAPWLAVGVAGVAFALVRGSRGGPNRTARILLAAWLCSVLFALVLAEAMHARFLGRHLAATMPLVVFAGIAFVRSRIATAALLVVFGVSDVRLSTTPAYAKDAYREVVARTSLLAAQRHAIIAWAADDLTANYYGLGFDYRASASDKLSLPWPAHLRAISASEFSVAQADELVERAARAGQPLYLVLSKPDIFDELGGWQRTLVRRGALLTARAPAFSVYLFDVRARAHPAHQ